MGGIPDRAEGVMVEYIEREAAIERLEKLMQLQAPTARAIIEAIPAADVRPVVLGKWINDHNGKYSSSGDNYFCSVCKDPSLRAFGKPAKTNYCPNCGADMRIFSTNCKNTVTTGEDREIFNLRAWLKNGKG